MERIKFYNIEDMSSGHYLKLVEGYIKDASIEDKELNINDVIELYNIFRYCEEFKLEIEEDDLTQFINKIPKTIGKFFSKFSFVKEKFDYEEIEKIYKEDFWEIFIKYGIIRKISIAEFESFLKTRKLWIYEILKYEQMCDKYELPIKTHLLSNPNHFEFFLTKHNEEETGIYLPNNFTYEEINNWARRYCELESPNVNFLEQIANWSDSHHPCKLDKKIILKAKKTAEEIINKHIESANGSFWQISVILDYNSYDSVDFQIEGMNSKISFGRGWLEDNIDTPTILNNFIFYFEFFSPIGTFAPIPSKQGRSNFTELFDKVYKYEYDMGHISSYLRMMYKLIFMAYFDFLQHKHIDLEEVFDFFYNRHIEKELTIPGFFYNKSNRMNNYYEKCKALVPEIDSIIKQFGLYQENLEVDYDLYEITDDKSDYRQVKSFSSKKFVYIKSDKIKRIVDILFSNESLLVHIKDTKSNQSFAEHVSNGINKKQLFPYQNDILKELTDHGIVNHNIVGQIYFVEEPYVVLLRLLWEKGYMCTFNLPKDLIQIVDKKVENEELRYGDTLLSTQECDYISYIMDNKTFSNALAIRNKYAHGSFAKKNETIHKENYIELLMILLLYTYRINEELEYNYEGEEWK